MNTIAGGRVENGHRVRVMARAIDQRGTGRSTATDDRIFESTKAPDLTRPGTSAPPPEVK